MLQLFENRTNLYSKSQKLKLSLPQIDDIDYLSSEKRSVKSVNSPATRQIIFELINTKSLRSFKKILHELFRDEGINHHQLISQNPVWVDNLFRFSRGLQTDELDSDNLDFKKYKLNDGLVSNGYISTKSTKLDAITELADYEFHEASKKNYDTNHKQKSPKDIYKWDRIVTGSKKLNSLLTSLLEKESLLPEISAYLNKRNVCVRKSSIVHSEPGDNQYKLFLGDLPYENKDIYYHIDPKGGLIKAMIYLNEVDATSGPFQVIADSLDYHYDQLQYLFARAISTANYCDSPQKRLLINSLPYGLRTSLNFGRLLEKTSTLSQCVNNNSVTFTSDFSNIILFVPDKIIHRGAVCTSSERKALQVHIY